MAEDFLPHQDEYSVLSSIYPSEFHPLSSQSFQFFPEAGLLENFLLVRLPADYPQNIHSPPIIDYSSIFPPLTPLQLLEADSLVSSEHEASGGPESAGSLFPVLQKIIEFLQNIKKQRNEKIKTEKEHKTVVKQSKQEDSVDSSVFPPSSFSSPSSPPLFISGPPLTDRKSVFQAHFARVHSVSDVSLVMASILSDVRIRRATHNIRAYRIRQGAVILHDNEDDGEDRAGERLAHLLHISGAENVFLVVSRWYGGVHLGPDRFRNISEVARKILKQQQEEQEKPHKGGIQ